MQHLLWISQIRSTRGKWACSCVKMIVIPLFRPDSVAHNRSFSVQSSELNGSSRIRRSWSLASTHARIQPFQFAPVRSRGLVRSVRPDLHARVRRAGSTPQALHSLCRSGPVTWNSGNWNAIIADAMPSRSTVPDTGEQAGQQECQRGFPAADIPGDEVDALPKRSLC